MERPGGHGYRIKLLILEQIVVLAAQEDPGCWGTALYMLDDATQVDPADPRALYLKAQLRFNLDAPKRTTTGYMDDNFMFDEFFEPSADDPTVNSSVINVWTGDYRWCNAA